MFMIYVLKAVTVTVSEVSTVYIQVCQHYVNT